ncbi:transcriptional regulator, AraC family with amidase-like domain [Propionibacteriaceae bacterium ES.041]|uniref:GlxA family transcriptional regulator n=1 Tax=Enemella evansiae TaxID=2016499 RepID=UPI000B95F498|nr:helix-turn-helix domain-containing protein [Enemella evansiae]OYN95084.1 AraC family transcriptional regulator [Enemella evansiae]PFG66293.1 transcriptional regulator, AraC family with amidase-like domain [Propionibacteriaceae bacterium ES.041]
MPLRSVAVLVRPSMSMFEFGVTAEVFGIDRTEIGLPAIDYRVCADRDLLDRSAPVPSKHTDPLGLVAAHGLDGIAGADLLIISAAAEPTPGTDAEITAIRTAHATGATVLSLCSGAFLLAQAGLLDGRRATTHWMYADRLAAAYPKTEVVSDELFIDHGDVITAAGTAAAVDTCLHLVRRELGQAVAAAIARRMVAAPQRHGSQLQYVERPVTPTPGPGLAPTLDWVLGRLDEPLDVTTLAQHAGVSPRQLNRWFLGDLGTTPLRWLTEQRIRLAQELLESSDLSVERIGKRVGYGSPTQLRQHFRRLVGSTPAHYRETFRAR